jgi:SAM-dependent methyltransferase
MTEPPSPETRLRRSTRPSGRRAAFALKDRLLSLSGGYLLVQWILGGTRARTIHLERSLRPRATDRVLDSGCGPATILRHLPSTVSYTGIDVEASYLAHARRTFGGRGAFVPASVDGRMPVDGPFDLVMMNGVLHHLDDRQASAVLAQVPALLAPGGCLVTMDGCFFPDTRGWRAWVLRHDRGKHVRTAEGYQALFAPDFPEVHAQRPSDLFPVSYDALTVTASLSERASAESR